MRRLPGTSSTERGPLEGHLRLKLQTADSGSSLLSVGGKRHRAAD